MDNNNKKYIEILREANWVIAEKHIIPIKIVKINEKKQQKKEREEE